MTWLAIALSAAGLLALIFVSVFCLMRAYETGFDEGWGKGQSIGLEAGRSSAFEGFMRALKNTVEAELPSGSQEALRICNAMEIRFKANPEERA